MDGEHSETENVTDHEARGADDADGTGRDGVVVDGETPTSLPAGVEAAAERFEVTTRTVGFECASGDWIEATWTGVPLWPLLEAASIPPETTHALVEAADGYRACVPVRALTDAMVAYDATDRPAGDFPRLVSPSVGGPRAVKGLDSVRPVELAPHEDPEDYEELFLTEA